jgi:hypothetical protein
MTSGAVPGKAFELKVSTLKSAIAFGSGRDAPGAIFHSCAMSTKSRSTRGPFGAFGCTTIIPFMPSAIWVISSECGWYMNVPASLNVNS